MKSWKSDDRRLESEWTDFHCEMIYFFTRIISLSRRERTIFISNWLKRFISNHQQHIQNETRQEVCWWNIISDREWSRISIIILRIIISAEERRILVINLRDCFSLSRSHNVHDNMLAWTSCLYHQIRKNLTWSSWWWIIWQRKSSFFLASKIQMLEIWLDYSLIISIEQSIHRIL